MKLKSIKTFQKENKSLLKEDLNFIVGGQAGTTRVTAICTGGGNDCVDYHYTDEGVLIKIQRFEIAC